MTMEGWGWFAVGGTLAASLWSYLKTLTWRCASLLVVRARLEADIGNAALLYCWKTMQRSPFGERRYGGTRFFVRPAQRYLQIGYERCSSDAMVFWHGWRPLSLSLWEGDPQRPHSGGVAVQITFLRGTFDLDSLLIQSLNALNDDQHVGQNGKRFTVERVFGNGAQKQASGFANMAKPSGDSPELAEVAIQPEWRLLRWDKDEIGAARATMPWSALSFPSEIEQLIEEIRRWKASEEWYKSKQIAWRMGINCFGAPGTGKSSFARAVAQDLDVPIISFDLASFSNDDFVRTWRRILARAPCMALLEDIDGVFLGRENRLGAEGGGLSFDCLLNCLSGVESADGVLVIITTNRIEDLDPALGVPTPDGASTRPGRIDRVVEMLPPDEACRQTIAQRILSDCPEEVARMVAEGNGDSGAQFVDRCAQVALRHYWYSGPRNGRIRQRYRGRRR